MKKIALYCRVSSDDQRKRETIDNQVDVLNTYVEMKEDWKIVDQFLDDGVSGTVQFENRPAGKQLIEGAKNGDFEAILVYRIDRFGRDTLSGLQAVESLRSLNVEIISYTEPFDLNTPTGRYQFINYLNMAELERNNILDRMFLGATRAAKQGRWLGGVVPYGYNVNNDGYLEINEEEAVVVRKMFDMYVNEGMNTVDIAVYLNTVGVPCFNNSREKGKRKNEVASLWSTGSIQRMLSNSTYMGIHEYGKRSSKRKDTIVRNVPPIITIEVWNEAVKCRKENMKMSNRNSPNRTFLLRTLIKCGECNRTYYGIFYRKSPSVYACSSKQSVIKKVYNTNCHNINLVADDIEEYIWGLCEEILLNYDDYTIELDEDKEIENLNEDLNSFKNKLVELDGEKSNILKLFRRNLIDENELEQQLEDIRKDIDIYKGIITDINSKIDIIKNKESVLNENKSKLELYRDRIDTLSDDDKMQVIRLLIKSITVSSEVESGDKVPYIHVDWNLSELLLEPSNVHNLTQKHCRKISSYYIEFKVGDILSSNNSNQRYSLVKNLRLINNITLKEFAINLGISENSLRTLESTEKECSYYYYNLYCRHFAVDPYIYLNYSTLPTETFEEKIKALKAFYGVKSSKELDLILGLPTGAIVDAKHGKRSKKKICTLMDIKISEYKKGYDV